MGNYTYSDNNSIGLGHFSSYSSEGAQDHIAIGHYTLNNNIFSPYNVITIGNYSLSNSEYENTITIGYKAAGEANSYLAPMSIGIGNEVIGDIDPLAGTVLAIGNRALFNQSFCGKDFVNFNPLITNSILSSNIAIGDSCLYYIDGTNPDQACFNTSLGQYSQYWNQNASKNTSLGSYTLVNNYDGWNNCHVGAHYDTSYVDIISPTSFSEGNTDLGSINTFHNGQYGVSIGSQRNKHLAYNEYGTFTGSHSGCIDENLYNTACGYNSLNNHLSQSFITNDTARFNTAFGYLAFSGEPIPFIYGLQANLCSYNTAIGAYSLNSIEGAYKLKYNTAYGYKSAMNFLEDSANVCVGFYSGYHYWKGYGNTDISNVTINQDCNENDTLSFNTLIGYPYYTQADGNTSIGFNYEETMDQENYYKNENIDKSNATKLYTDNTNGLTRIEKKISICNYANIVSGMTINTNFIELSIISSTFYIYNSYYPFLADSILIKNISIGYHALFNNNTYSTHELHNYDPYVPGSNPKLIDYSNLAIGYTAIENDTVGKKNLAIGFEAQNSNIAGNDNICLGNNSLYSNTYSSGNIAIGDEALYSLTYSNSETEWRTDNIAIGTNSMYTLNPTNSNYGKQNTAIGVETMQYATIARGNTIAGYQADRYITDGEYNTALGNRSLLSNSSGDYNVAFGSNSMSSNVSGKYNIGISYQSLRFMLTGDYNTAIGTSALDNLNGGNCNTAVGALSSVVINESTNYSTYIGFYASPNTYSTAHNYSTAIGYYAFTSDTCQVRIGNSTANPATSIGGPVGWTTVSDGRFKENVKENVPGLNFIMKLRPVTYNYNLEKQNDFMNVPDSCRDKNAAQEQFQIVRTGFIAQEVEQAAKECNFDFDGIDKPGNDLDFYALRYASFVVPLTKAVQEQQVLIESNQQIIDSNQQILDELQKQNELYLELLEQYAE